MRRRWSALLAIAVVVSSLLPMGAAGAATTTTTTCAATTGAGQSSTTTVADPSSVTSSNQVSASAASGSAGSSGTSSLPLTGAQVDSTLAVGLTMILGGGLAVLAARRRRRPAQSKPMLAVLFVPLAFVHVAGADASSCGVSPTVPEVPMAAMLPLVGLATFVAVEFLIRRRRRTYLTQNPVVHP